MKSPYEILIRPVITEKATLLAERKDGPQYVFKVRLDANKIEIKRAIEAAYGVKVKAVNTVRLKGKSKRQGRFEGRRSDWKKAYVTLQEGQKIEVI
ncbi:MAG: 50S ribosomal protein L23 [Candidatus Hydrogenedentota bacterium]|jgi:large subunit ribosomal protein L23|uniref:Large ribosomal subunit protein uL23 n=1 Tax=Sumerlaea chitinivorans TaxID=2250252 RepID=A0A2Z4Y3Z2_SUMC1|nr:LSU ribosomal protein L23p (L23Ae) [Candidatus Sumerlaea chitinivorans]MCX7963626.1 50S ribosomal protein L23 [Candidatus Sumerlaea chitinivorans]RMH25881.1 MAG: 50S ribosomal protein L23 [Candidatus Hydrogenedentota bacterium]GIX45322.1 MAG: 50S ribosomal protein L23 [Candidatus Sumerlaea sp.]